MAVSDKPQNRIEAQARAEAKLDQIAAKKVDGSVFMRAVDLACRLRYGRKITVWDVAIASVACVRALGGSPPSFPGLVVGTTTCGRYVSAALVDATGVVHVILSRRGRRTLFLSRVDLWATSDGERLSCDLSALAAALLEAAVVWGDSNVWPTDSREVASALNDELRRQRVIH